MKIILFHHNENFYISDKALPLKEHVEIFSGKNLSDPVKFFKKLSQEKTEILVTAGFTDEAREANVEELIPIASGKEPKLGIQIMSVDDETMRIMHSFIIATPHHLKKLVVNFGSTTGNIGYLYMNGEEKCLISAAFNVKDPESVLRAMKKFAECEIDECVIAGSPTFLFNGWLKNYSKLGGLKTTHMMSADVLKDLLDFAKFTNSDENGPVPKRPNYLDGKIRNSVDTLLGLLGKTPVLLAARDPKKSVGSISTEEAKVLLQNLFEEIKGRKEELAAEGGAPPELPEAAEATAVADAKEE